SHSAASVSVRNTRTAANLRSAITSNTRSRPYNSSRLATIAQRSNRFRPPDASTCATTDRSCEKSGSDVHWIRRAAVQVGPPEGLADAMKRALGNWTVIVVLEPFDVFEPVDVALFECRPESDGGLGADAGRLLRILHD